MTDTQGVADDSQPRTSEQIFDHFKAMILAGELAAEAKLPTVRQTATDYGAAPGTAAKAYKQLEEHGLVVARSRAGTRVAPRSDALSATVTELLREAVAESKREGLVRDTVLGALRSMWDEGDGRGVNADAGK